MIVSVTRAVPILFALRRRSRKIAVSEHRRSRCPRILQSDTRCRNDTSSSDNHTLFTMSKIEEPSGFCTAAALTSSVVRNWFETARKVIRASPIRYCSSGRGPLSVCPLSTAPRVMGRWWRRSGLNRRPPGCKPGALPLSYAPKSSRRGWKLVGPGRFELPTSRLSSARSNQLSYEPPPEGQNYWRLLSCIGSGRDALAAASRMSGRRDRRRRIAAFQR